MRASFAALALGLAACSADITSPSPSGTETSVLVGAGDIAVCGVGGSMATGRLLDTQPGTVFIPGDIAYPDGTAAQFRDCYDPAWGRHKDRTRPVPGNHEYGTPGAAAFFAYFGANAGPPGLGYYRYRSGGWTVFALTTRARRTGVALHCRVLSPSAGQLGTARHRSPAARRGRFLA
jgi:hypothetical protein